MFILLFLLWILFNERVTVETVVIGLIIAAAVYVFLCLFTGYKTKQEKKFLRNILTGLRYAAVVLREIFKANIGCMRLILSPKYEPEPVLIKFKTNLKSQMTRVMFANTITITPGTVTVALEEDEYIIHCLDRDFAEGLDDPDSDLMKLLMKMEAK